MLDYIKQDDSAFNQAPFDAIQTDGCLWRTLLHCPESLCGGVFKEDELKRAFCYSIPEYMEDHRRPNEDRCYIKNGGHVEIMRIGFYILGRRNVKIAYRYRYDYHVEEFQIGNEKQLERCNFFIGKCRHKKSGHFYESDKYGTNVWNPADIYNRDLLSLRGFYVEIK